MSKNADCIVDYRSEGPLWTCLFLIHSQILLQTNVGKPKKKKFSGAAIKALTPPPFFQSLKIA